MNNNWSKNLGFTLKMRRPPKWNYEEIATMRVYCSNQTENKENCKFGISIRYDEQNVGPFWCLGETYDPHKMTHSCQIQCE